MSHLVLEPTLLKFFFRILFISKIIFIFANQNTEDVAQLVRASVCGAEGRGFETHLPPLI